MNRNTSVSLAIITANPAVRAESGGTPVEHAILMTALRYKFERKLMLDFDDRPWGRWEEYLNEDNYRLKRIIVKPGKRLSLQWHRLRAEYWIIVGGAGLLTLDDRETAIQTGDTAFIPVGSVHRVQNTGQEDLVIIEVQTGQCLEDDIVRLEDDWNRR